MLRGKFIAIQAFLKKEEKSEIDNLTQHLNELEKEEQAKPKVSRRKEIIKIKEEINKIEIHDHILVHKKANLNKFRSIEIISSIFSDHEGMKPEINHRKRNEKKTRLHGN